VYVFSLLRDGVTGDIDILLVGDVNDRDCRHISSLRGVTEDISIDILLVSDVTARGRGDCRMGDRNRNTDPDIVAPDRTLMCNGIIVKGNL